MIKLKQAVIVEGRYDKIRLSGFLDALIIPTNGFQIFSQPKKRALIAKLAVDPGIIVMTDSDHAGQMIRSHLKSIAAGGNIIMVYLPQVVGKERRKQKPSAEGYLGVEGLSEAIILTALRKSGVLSNEADSPKNQHDDAIPVNHTDESGVLSGEVNLPHTNKRQTCDYTAAEVIPVTKADLFCAGMIGCEGSADRRKALYAAFALPDCLSVNEFLLYINRTGKSKILRSLLDKQKR